MINYDRPNKLNELIRGAIDLHCHVYPEVSLEQENRLEDDDQIQAAIDAGLAGIVLKSHLWPTVERAYYLGKRFRQIQVIGSISLNPIAGGFDPLIVEIAARQGARVIFFPTWQSENDLSHGGFSSVVRRRMPLYGPKAEFPAAPVTKDGKLTPAAEQVLDAAKDLDLLVMTGHCRADEGLLVIEGAAKRGVRVIYSHPQSTHIGATNDDLKKAAALGALIEISSLGAISVRAAGLSRAQVAEGIKAVGAEHFVIVSDAFNPYAPPQPELFRMGAGQIVEVGIPIEQVRKMVYDNPRRALGM